MSDRCCGLCGRSIADRPKQARYCLPCIPETKRAITRRYAKAHPERVKALYKSWSSKNKGYLREKRRARNKLQPPDREAARRRGLKWARANREKRHASYLKNAEKIKARSAARYAANRAAELEKMAARYAADPVPRRAQTRAWARANPDKRREHIRTASCKRRAHARGAGGRGVTRTEWEAIAAWHDHRCAYCFVLPKKLTRDHVVPLVSGGPDEPDNVVPACAFCNASKGKKELRAWLGLKNDRHTRPATEGILETDRVSSNDDPRLRVSA